MIKKWLALIPDVIKNVDVTSNAGREIVADGIDFIRSYADRFHHGKEEAILFKCFDENSEIIQAMRDDHETGRSHVKAISEALEKGDAQTSMPISHAYRELLPAHIKKEDEILFPWMDRNLSEADKDNLSLQFNEADMAAGQGHQKEYEKIISTLGHKIK